MLLIEDNPGDARLIVELIKEAIDFKCSINVAVTLKEGTEKLNQDHYDIILLDLSLPDSHGIETYINLSQKHPNIPVIVLTGLDDSELALKAVKIGAQDYLQKTGLTGDLLVKSIVFSIERKRAQIELVKLNDELEEKVAARTEELARALEEEKEVGEMKSSFVTMASHEFRTPLSGILTATELIEKYNKLDIKDKQAKHLNRIKKSVRQLVNILNDFLSIEQIEQGKIEANKADFNLNQFASELVNDISSITKENQEIVYSYIGDEEVYLDKKILTSIISNLLSNSIKYSDAQIDFTISVHNSIVNICVTDYGIGIPLEDQKHLFSKFFRAKNATNIQGTGLGLNIVKSYVELLGGEITLDSTPKVKTTFAIEIPISIYK